MWSSIIRPDIDRLFSMRISKLIVTGFGCGGGAATLLAYALKQRVHYSLLSLVQVGTPKVCSKELYDKLSDMYVVNLDFGFDPFTMFPFYEPQLVLCPYMRTMYSKEISQAHHISNYVMFENELPIIFVPTNYAFKGLNLEGMPYDLADVMNESHKFHHAQLSKQEYINELENKKIEIVHRIVGMSHEERIGMPPLNLKMIIALNSYIVKAIDNVLIHYNDKN